MSGDPIDRRDAHLQAALRHAPDAALAPPAALDELILREAHAKLRGDTPPASAAGRRSPLMRWWDWLAQPAAATSMAGLMVAGLAAVLWHYQGGPVAVEEATRPTVAITAEPPATAPAAGSAAPVLAQAPQPPERSAPAAKTAPAMPAAKDARSARADAGAAPSAQDLTLERRAVAAAPPAPMPEPPPVMAPPAQVAAAVPPPMPAAPVAPPAPVALAAAKPAARAEAADAARSGLPVEPAPATAAAPAAAAQGYAPSLRAGAAEMATAAAAAAPPGLVELRARLNAEPQRWTWQRGDAAPRPVDAAVQAWLAQLDRAVGGRWQPHADTGAGRDLLALRRGDAGLQRLRLDGERLIWLRAGQPALEASLTAEQARVLVLALDAAAAP